MAGREDMRSHSCDLCGEGFANKQDFDEHNALEHESRVMGPGDSSDRPLRVVQVVAPPSDDAPPKQETEQPEANAEEEEPKAEEPKAESEEPEDAKPKAEDEEAEDEDEEPKAEDAEQEAKTG